MKSLEELLAETAVLHKHLCPRQVLGVRMGMWAGTLLGLDVPQTKKRLYTIVETDGCFVDGVSAATNCWVGRRTMRVEDYGKVAATFVDTKTEEAIRIFPALDVRECAPDFAPEAKNRWQGYLLGYQRMPLAKMFVVQTVQLRTPIGDLISRAGVRVNCVVCAEEIINEREVERGGVVLCRSCAGDSYYALPVVTAVLPPALLKPYRSIQTQ